MKAKRFTCHGERCSHSELVLCPLGEQLCPLRGQTSGFYQEPELYVRRSPQEGTSHSVVQGCYGVDTLTTQQATLVPLPVVFIVVVLR